MAKNDMHLIIYKILRYLYDCNKQGKTPCFSDMFIAAELALLPKSYIAQILQELISCGYIDGCRVTITKDAPLIELSDKAYVTLKGAEYLAENSRMQKAAKVAGTAFEILLEGIIAAAL